MKKSTTVLLFGLLCISIQAHAQQPLQFKVRLTSDVAQQPVSGRVYVFLSTRSGNPMRGPSWFSPEPFFAVDVEQLKPGDSVVIDNRADACPVSLDELEAKEYNVQAVLDQDFYFANHNNGPGNLYSQPRKLKLDPANGQIVELDLTEVIGDTPTVDTKWYKTVVNNSKLLADFHEREVIERAGVILPANYYEDETRRYPVYYVITGFGGTLRNIQNRWPNGYPESTEGNEDFIRVYLTGQCKWGHHVYANSATNGPRGDALIREMIPLIDKQFRTIAAPTARFVGGHSSGGWASLWLQVTYPETFGGVWSTAPDPVDFRDWQGTNLYEPTGANVYFTSKGNKKPLARRGRTPVIMYADFGKMDDALGRGGQLRSFEAVFSPRDENGLPAKCWDRKTGDVKPEIVEYWKRYDISQILERNWAELAPKLAGKIHVYMGEIDTFYLEGATELLGKRLSKLGSDAKVEIFPGKDHSSLMSRDLRERIMSEMSAQYRKHHPQP